MSPSAHTSVAGRMGAPASDCSGAIQRGVPTGLVWSASPCDSCTSLATPKSRIFTVKASPCRRELAMKMFCGLRSRCTRPCLCASPSAWQAWRKISIVSEGARNFLRWMRFASSSPSSSSIASQGMPVSSSTPAETTSTTWSLRIFAPTLASCAKRARLSSLCTNCGCITLSARSRPVEICSTR